MKIDFDPRKIPGLSSEEVGKKLISEGYNELPSSKSRNFITIAIGVIKEPMFLLLVACGTLYMVLGDIQEGIMLLSFVFVIMGIEFYQEKKTEKALDALRDLASPRALKNGSPEGRLLQVISWSFRKVTVFRPMLLSFPLSTCLLMSPCLRANQSR
jgi:Ca2+-transporting ATPase